MPEAIFTLVVRRWPEVSALFPEEIALVPGFGHTVMALFAALAGLERSGFLLLRHGKAAAFHIQGVLFFPSTVSGDNL
ncbi:MAG: hypothetical protein HLX51_01300 [Micrococcaceae bacterium]|nr:hypothetical protein [Micrococcaceae bacterium]